MSGRPSAAEAVVDGYFAALAAAAERSGAPIGPDEVAELRAHVAERLASTAGTAQDAERVLAELGDPARLAREFAAAREDGGEGPAGGGSLVGRVLGMPYDLRNPSSDRFATRMWDPSNPRVLVPKALGVGWTVNFGAVAVALHLVRPDDEDAPFASAPPGVVAGTLAAPIAVVVVLGALVATRWRTLPGTVPTHWDAAGHANGYSSRGAALVLVGLIAVVPLLFAVGVHLRRRSAVNRVVASALALGFGTVALAIAVQTLVSAGGGTRPWITWLGIVGFVALPLALLVGVSRLGRAAEQRRDLSSSKGQSW